MSLKYDLILAEAQSWLNTPWQHNQHCKGVDGGCDCVWLVVESYRAAGCLEQKVLNYYRSPQGDSLYLKLKNNKFLEETKNIKKGYIILFLVDKVPHHVAIAVDGENMIHSDQRSGKCCQHSIGVMRNHIHSIFKLKKEFE